MWGPGERSAVYRQQEEQDALETAGGAGCFRNSSVGSYEEEQDALEKAGGAGDRCRGSEIRLPAETAPTP